MSQTRYTNLYVITELQMCIMRFIDYWVMTQKIPIPQKEIYEEMQRRSYKDGSTERALTGLLKLGYIRRAILGADEPLNVTKYVQLRRV